MHHYAEILSSAGVDTATKLCNSGIEGLTALGLKRGDVFHIVAECMRQTPNADYMRQRRNKADGTSAGICRGAAEDRRRRVEQQQASDEGLGLCS